MNNLLIILSVILGFFTQLIAGSLIHFSIKIKRKGSNTCWHIHHWLFPIPIAIALGVTSYILKKKAKSKKTEEEKKKYILISEILLFIMGFVIGFIISGFCYKNWYKFIDISS
jgi:cell division protein FtsW (lipid II flippase)